MTSALPERPYPLHWPEDWRRTPASQRRPAPYRVGFVDTRDLITDELRLMVSGKTSGHASIVLSSNVPTRRDGIPYANYEEPPDPGAAVWWIDKVDEIRVIACDGWVKVADNFRAIGLTIQALRTIERTKASQILERTMQSFKVHVLPSDAGRDGTPGLPWWCAPLELDRWPVVEDVVNEHFRALARKYHPDRGFGLASEKRFQEITQAQSAAIRSLRPEKRD